MAFEESGGPFVAICLTPVAIREGLAVVPGKCGWSSQLSWTVGEADRKLAQHCTEHVRPALGYVVFSEDVPKVLGGVQRV